MTKWRIPTREFAAMIALIKFMHFMAGLYIWEFVLNLDYDYSVIMRKRKFTISHLFYIGCRWCTLCTVIVQFLIMDTSHDINCQVLVSMTFIFNSLSVFFASVLVILRIYALWEKNKVVIAIVSTCWLANAASLTYVVATSRGHWTDDGCVFDNILNTRVSIPSTFISDLVILLLMVSGVLRWKEIHEESHTWWLLYKQGLAWIVLFTLAEVPPLVFIILDLNDHMNMMFPVAGVIAMTVGASRMYRGLVEMSVSIEEPSLWAKSAEKSSPYPIPSVT